MDSFKFEVSQYIKNRTTLDYAKTYPVGNPVGSNYTTCTFTVPERGQLHLRFGNAAAQVIISVNGTVIANHGTVSSDVDFFIIQVDKGDVVSFSGTVLSASLTPFKI